MENRKYSFVDTLDYTRLCLALLRYFKLKCIVYTNEGGLELVAEEDVEAQLLILYLCRNYPPSCPPSKPVEELTTICICKCSVYSRLFQIVAVLTFVSF